MLTQSTTVPKDCTNILLKKDTGKGICSMLKGDSTEINSTEDLEVSKHKFTHATEMVPVSGWLLGSLLGFLPSYDSGGGLLWISNHP